MRQFRLWMLVAAAFIVPAQSIASAASLKACAERAAPAASVAVAMDCCDPQAPQGPLRGAPDPHRCAGMACLCVVGDGQPPWQEALSAPTSLGSVNFGPAISPIATLTTTPSPQGLWRPPRAS
jgi:hypothetical protein